MSGKPLVCNNRKNMKKILALVIAMVSAICVCAADNDNRLWYQAPATHWLEALPLGNSRMGAMVFGGTDVEEIQLNEETFWSGGPHNNNSRTSIYHLNEVRDLIFSGRPPAITSIGTKLRISSTVSSSRGLMARSSSPSVRSN